MKNDVSKKKTSKEKRVLIAALCIAATVAAGSTFAWFSSSDEVTNRLSASASYGVTIAEDFTPPENWVPGQKVDKNVGVVNTGNVDAFVRTWLEGEMNLLAQTKDVSKWDATNKVFPAGDANIGGTVSSGTITGLTAVSDADLNKLNLNYSFTDSDNTYYLKELSTDLYKNPNNDSQDTNSPTQYSEVMSVQAGGELVYTTGTSYTFTPNQTISVVSKENVHYDIVKGAKYTVTIGTISGSTDNIKVTTATGGATGTIEVTDVNVLTNIDSNTLQPTSTGLYIFRRNVQLGTTDDYEFSGYYYVSSGAEGSGTIGKYFALQYDTANTQRSDYVLPDDAVTSYTRDAATGLYTFTPKDIYLYTAQQSKKSNADLKWDYDATTAGSEKFVVTYGTGANQIKVNIGLSNIGDDSEKWTAIGDDSLTTATSTFAVGSDKYTFYYNNDVEEGATTAQLVDYVELDSSVTQQAYLAFDFDLNVFMDSVQVTTDDNGNETYTSVTPWKSSTSDDPTSNVARANAAAGVDNGARSNASEIEKITWTKSTT